MSSVTESSQAEDQGKVTGAADILKAFDGHLKNNHSLKSCSGGNGLISNCDSCQGSKKTGTPPAESNANDANCQGCECAGGKSSKMNGSVCWKNSARDSGVDIASSETKPVGLCELQVSPENGDGPCCADKSGMVSCDSGVSFPQAADNTDSSSSGNTAQSPPAEEEDRDEHVMMRNSRRSVNRKGLTDTALISNVFNFLQTNDNITEDLIDKEDSRQRLISESLLVHSTHGIAEENLTDLSEAVSSEPEPGGNGCDSHVSGNISDTCVPQQSPSNVPSECPAHGDCSSTLVSDNVPSESHGDSSSTDVSEDTPSKPVSNGDVSSPQGAGEKEDSVSEMSPASSTADTEVRLRRSRLSRQESTEETVTDDSSDEDVGVYAESYRRSNWIRLDDDGNLELSMGKTVPDRLSCVSEVSSSCVSDFGDSTDSPGDFGDSIDSPVAPSPKTDEVFNEPCPSPQQFKYHKRSDSTTTTLSEREFKKEYVLRRKCLIQRKNSSKEYHRFSARVCDEEKSLLLEKGPEDSDYGLHIFDSQPAFITQVDPGSPAERAGVQEGQILVSINGTNVLTATHAEIVSLMAASPGQVRLAVAASDFQPSRDLQASVIEGYMQKLSEGLVRLWKKRYFILRQDSCLYYYKQKDDTDPLGAIPLAGYTFSRHLDHGKDYSFKAEKYGAKTYYFVTESRDEMTEWVGALTDAAARSKKRKESFMSVSSHNVGLPALEVRRPECTGYMVKMGHRHKTWRRRYCVLKDGCLYYYKNMNSLSALGVAHLHGYKVDPWMSVGKKHSFGLVPPDPSLRTFRFSAENDTDRERWVDAMIRSIQRWVQVDNDC